MDHQEFMRQFEVEARRLGLNMLRLPALATSGNDRSELLERMRALAPGATWEDVIPGLRLSEPDPEIAEEVAAMDSDPDAFWRERELALDLWHQIERVMPIDRASVPEGMGIGYTFPFGQEHALRALRGLPDRAGYEAFLAALESTPVDE